MFTLNKSEKTKKVQDIFDMLSFHFRRQGLHQYIGPSQAVDQAPVAPSTGGHNYLVLTLYLHEQDSHQARLNKVSDLDSV